MRVHGPATQDKAAEQRVIARLLFWKKRKGPGSQDSGAAVPIMIDCQPGALAAWRRLLGIGSGGRT